MSQAPEHYLGCIEEARETIERLERQLARMAKNQPGRKYLHERIACEKNIITLLERDYQEVVVA